MKKILLSLICAVFVGSLAAQIPVNGLRSFYTFNSSMQDSTSSGNHFTPFINPPANNDVKVWGNDRRTNSTNGSFYNFVSGHFTAQPLKLADSASSFTVSLWVQMNSRQLDTKTILGDYNVISFFQGPSFAQGKFRISMYNGHPQFIMYKQGTYTLIDDFVDSVRVGEWNHLAAVYDRATSTMRFYLNGKLVSGSHRYHEAATTAFGVFHMGRTLVNFTGGPNPTISTTELFDGTLDDIAVYTRALSECEIQSLANKAAQIPNVSVYASNLELSASVLNASSYQWLNCKTNLPVQGANQRVFNATTKGYYKVVVNSGCGIDTSECALAANMNITRQNIRGSYDFNTNLVSNSPNMADFTKLNEIPGNPGVDYSIGRDGRPFGAFNNANSGLFSATNLNTEAIDTPDISAFIWVKPNEAVSDAFVVSDFSAINGTPRGSFYLRIIENRLRIGLVQRNGNVLFAESGPQDTIQVNAWTNLGIVFDRNAGVATGFIDGNPVCSLLNVSNIGPSEFTFLGGFLNKNSSVPAKGLSFNGSFDELYIHDRALGACDINKMFGVPVTLIQKDVEKRGEQALYAKADLVSYQWMDCDTRTLIPGERKKLFVPSKPGNYAAVLFNGCYSDTSECFYLSLQTTGIDDPGFGQLAIHPNPSDNLVNVSGVDVSRLELMNLSGQVVATSSTNQISLSEFNQGIYFLKVSDKLGKSLVRKIVRK